MEIKIPEDILDWLKTYHNDPIKALQIIRDGMDGKKDFWKEIGKLWQVAKKNDLELMKLEETLDKIIELNNLRF